MKSLFQKCVKLRWHPLLLSSFASTYKLEIKYGEMLDTDFSYGTQLSRKDKD
jgi:hypothetical protein